MNRKQELFAKLLHDIVPLTGRAARILRDQINETNWARGVPLFGGRAPDSASTLINRYREHQLITLADCADDIGLLIDSSRWANVAALCCIAFEARMHFAACIGLSDYAATRVWAALVKLPKPPASPDQESEPYVDPITKWFAERPEKTAPPLALQDVAVRLNMLEEFRERMSRFEQANWVRPAFRSRKHVDMRGLFVHVFYLLDDLIETANLCVPQSRSNEDPLAELTLLYTELKQHSKSLIDSDWPGTSHR